MALAQATPGVPPPNSRRLLVVTAAVVVAGVVVALAVRATTSAATATRWVGSWAASMHEPALTGLTHDGFDNQTVRMVVHVSIGGDAVRIRLSNEFGTKPLTIGDATVGVPAKTHDGAVTGLHRISFSGRTSTVVPIGGELLSDAVPMAVPTLSDLTVSLWLPVATGPTTFHTVSRATSYVGDGDHAEDASAGGYAPVSVDNPIPGKTDSPWFYLTGVDVQTDRADGAVVVFGDSISDGFTSALDGNERWPDLLAVHLAALPVGRHAPGVLNASLSGDALGHQSSKIPQLGPTALSRIDNDVLSQTGVRTVIVELGINDLMLWGEHADAVVTELRQVAVRVHEARLSVFVCTISPYSAPPDGENERQLVNRYIRSATDFDGVIDMDQVLRDPNDGTKLRSDLDSGDHVHPTARGYQLIADAMPLSKIAP